MLGIKIALDDFGTGHSSLSYFRRLPVSMIKIDQSLIHEMIEQKQIARLVKSMIELAYNLNIPAVAEGVETKRTAAFIAGDALPSCSRVFVYIIFIGRKNE